MSRYEKNHEENAKKNMNCIPLSRNGNKVLLARFSEKETEEGTVKYPNCFVLAHDFVEDKTGRHWGHGEYHDTLYSNGYNADYIRSALRKLNGRPVKEKHLEDDVNRWKHLAYVLKEKLDNYVNDDYFTELIREEELTDDEMETLDIDSDLKPKKTYRVVLEKLNKYDEYEEVDSEEYEDVDENFDVSIDIEDDSIC